MRFKPVEFRLVLSYFRAVLFNHFVESVDYKLILVATAVGCLTGRLGLPCRSRNIHRVCVVLSDTAASAETLNH